MLIARTRIWRHQAPGLSPRLFPLDEPGCEECEDCKRVWAPTKGLPARLRLRGSHAHVPAGRPARAWESILVLGAFALLFVTTVVLVALPVAR